MTQPHDKFHLDQVSRDWADAKRQEREEIEEAMRQHRLRTASHPGLTRREAEEVEQRAANRQGWAMAFLLLGLLGVGLALVHFLLHCGGSRVMGC